MIVKMDIFSKILIMKLASQVSHSCHLNMISNNHYKILRV